MTLIVIIWSAAFDAIQDINKLNLESILKLQNKAKMFFKFPSFLIQTSCPAKAIIYWDFHDEVETRDTSKSPIELAKLIFSTLVSS